MRANQNFVFFHLSYVRDATTGRELPPLYSNASEFGKELLGEDFLMFKILYMGTPIFFSPFLFPTPLLLIYLYFISPNA